MPCQSFREVAKISGAEARKGHFMLVMGGVKQDRALNLLKFCDDAVIRRALKFDGAENIVGLFRLNPTPHQAQKPRRVANDIAE
jgi:predicted TIM-barrel enzyme